VSSLHSARGTWEGVTMRRYYPVVRVKSFLLKVFPCQGAHKWGRMRVEAILSTVGLQLMTHELLVVEDSQPERRAAGNWR